MYRIFNIAAIAILFGSLWGAAPAQAEPPAEGPNLLKNPGFEYPYFKQCCHTEPQYFPNTPIDEVQVANGWRGWWLEPRYPDYPPTCDGCIAWHRPEWREAAPFANRIHGGSNAQKYFTFFSVHKAGMYQQVSGLTPGQKLRFSIYMHAWSTNGGGLTSTIADNNMNMKVGIDPTGGADPFSANIVWSAPVNAWDAWTLFTVEAVAQNSTVTVYTHSQPRWGLEHNDIYVDDASLVVTDGSVSSAPTAPPAPPNPPPPAATSTPGPAPSAPTAAPAPTFTTYVVQPGDTLYKIARKFNTTVTTLQSLNGIVNAARIFVGQTLKIPGAGAPVAAPISAPPATGGQATTYTVQRGDRLVYIARKFNTTLNAIIAMNPGLDPNRIFVGQVINIPATLATRSYVVQNGDTLRKITDKFGVTVAAIQALNSLANPNTIFVGQLLLIP